MNKENITLIEDRFGTDHKQAGHGELTFNCPFCIKKRGKADNDHKLYVNSESLKFHCFKCNTSGRLKTNSDSQISSSVIDALFEYFESGCDSEDTEEESEDNMFYFPVTQILPDTVAYKYCVDRGITKDLIDYYDIRLGVGDLTGRIVIPNTVYGNCWTDMYSARTVVNQIPKYKNPTGAKKNRLVFNLNRISEGADIIIIVEGVITAICGGKDCVAVYGCHPSTEQLDQILEKKSKAIYVCLDGDEAGQSGMLPTLEYLASKYSGDLFYIKMPKDKDACDLGNRVYRKYVDKHKKKFVNSLIYSLDNFFAE